MRARSTQIFDLASLDTGSIKHIAHNTLTGEDDEPKPATGDDLKFIKQVLEVAKKSEDPHTKVASRTVDTVKHGSRYDDR